jgi:hypothetical protein
MAPEPKAKRSILRSPNFPSIDLGAAIGRAKVIYEREKRAATSADVILKHLGYKRRSGAAGRVLSALLQYGLLEKHNTLYRLSEHAHRILNLSETSPERRRAMEACALRPSLFRELLTTYKDGLPSDDTLKDQLIANRQFNPTSVSLFIQVFRGTIELAKVAPGDYKGDEPDADDGLGAQAMQEDGARTDSTNPTPPPPRGERERLRFTLSGERGVRIIFSGPDPTQAEIDELMDYLKVSRRTFPAALPDRTGDPE